MLTLTRRVGNQIKNVLFYQNIRNSSNLRCESREIEEEKNRTFFISHNKNACYVGFIKPYPRVFVNKHLSSKHRGNLKLTIKSRPNFKQELFPRGELDFEKVRTRKDKSTCLKVLVY